MKIGLDISLLCLPKTGIGQYRYHLIKALLALENCEYEFCLYGFNYRWNHLLRNNDFADKCEVQIPRIPNRLLSIYWNFFSKPRLEDLIKSCDFFHLSETGFQPTKKPSVYTIHDLTVEKFPHLHTEQNRFFALSRHRNAAKSNAHFIAVSNQTKKDFIEIYGVDPQRISVVHHGVAIEQIDSVNEDMREKCLRKFGLSNERFVLFVGTLEPRKNLVNLIRAFAGIRNSQTDLKLVIVGMKGWRYEEIFEQIDYCNLREKFLWLGYLDEADKYALMKACEFFVYPSLYEGFGLPVLEAMACSKAIVTSENSAMSEFSKGAAIFVDPKKTDQLGGAMLELLTNEELKKNMSTQAREIAEKMSWKKCALDVLDVYKRTFAELNSEKTP